MRALIFAGIFSLAACTAKSPSNDDRSCPQGEPSDDAGTCKVEGLRCAYGPLCGATVQCTSGVWQTTNDGCSDAARTCPSSAPRSGEPCPGPASCPYACGDGGTLTATCNGGSWNVVATGCALP